jgi:guanylate kinase
MRKHRGNLFVVSAPSGAGKTTLLRKLAEKRPGARFSVSYTTRKPRPGEEDGRDYSFVSEEEFRAMARRGEFAEWAEVHGNLYGTSRERLEEMLEGGFDVLHDVDVQGAGQMRGAYPDAVYIFVLPPSRGALRERLAARGSDSEDAIKRRLRKAADEIRDYLSYDYVIVNDVFEEALKELDAVVEARGLDSRRVDPEWVRSNFITEEEG